MPAFSFLCPSFLHFRRPRSRSQKPYPSLAMHDRGAALPSLPTDRPSSVPGVSEQDMPTLTVLDYPMQPHFIDGNVNTIIRTSPIKDPHRFMEQLMKETILGAAFDSSARDPPPRCHPGTRLTILARCLHFISYCSGVQKMRWVVGAAGVGKTALMQSVAESPNLAATLQASVFLSVFGREDCTRVVTTIAYQLAAKSQLYRRLIEIELDRDPTLLQRSMPIQFQKFIVEPFIRHPQLTAGRVLIIIDGLDECNNSRTEQDLLRVISGFCIEYPSSPVVWFITSRPERHINSTFSQARFIPTYEKEEIPVDSDEARADVERFLRDQLMKMRDASDSLDPQWPEERDFWKLANAANGYFVYALAAIKYISDSNGESVSRLSDVPYIIDRHMLTNIEKLPFEFLRTMYARFLSNIPQKVVTNARKLLLSLAVEWDQYLLHDSNLVLLGNWLCMTPDEVYAATNCLDLVLRIPSRNKCHEEKLEPLYKSFMDHLTESRFFGELETESHKLKSQCAFKILEDAPDGLDLGDMGYGAYHGTLARGSGTGEGIRLTWVADVDQWREGCWDDNMTRFGLYNLAVAEIADGMARGDPTFRSQSCIHLLTTRFKDWGLYFPYYSLRDSVFDRSRRDEFMVRGILNRIPLNAIDASSVAGLLNELYDVKLNFRHVAGEANLSDRWDQSCTHGREGDSQSWTTTFKVGGCDSCSNRLRRQLEIINTQSSDCAVPIMFTSSDNCCVEFQYMDPEDSMSEWTYWFWYGLSWDERKKYGSDV